MSLNQLEAHISSNRDQASELNQQFESNLAAIRANQSLSASGRQTQVARAYLDTTTKIGALQADEQATLEKKQADLNRSVFGIYNTDPMSIIAFRDAQDRASRLETWQDANALLDSSALAGDGTLAAAVMARALAKGWSEVTNAYIASHPAQADALTDLAEISQFTTTRQNQLMNYLQYVTVLPSELTGMMPYQIQQLAGGSDSSY